MKALRIAALAALALAVAALAGVGRPERSHAAEPQAGGITVQGEGTATTVPDHASFTFGVRTDASTAAQALAESSAAARRVIAAVRKAGVAEADIRTEQVSLTTRTSSDGTRIVGYTAQNTVAVVVRDLGSAGDVVDAAVGAGATDVFGPRLLRSDQDALYRSALKAAIANARAKAEALAQAAGVSLDRVTSVVEGGGPVPVTTERAAAPTAGPPIEPGTEEINASVSVTFAVS